MAFQLELNRMRTYDLEALATSNRKMYLYLGKAKVRPKTIFFVLTSFNETIFLNVVQKV